MKASYEDQLRSLMDEDMFFDDNEEGMEDDMFSANVCSVTLIII